VQIIYSSTSQSDNLRVQTNLSAQTPMARSESRPALTANYFGPIRNLQGHILYDDMGFETGHGLGMERRSSNLSKEDLVVGNNIVLNNVLFNPGSDLLRPESRPALEELFEVMEEYSTLKIEVHGHICCVTEDPTDLSGRRAREVRNFLTRQGIEPNRIRARGFGATQRLYPLEQNEYEKQMNRRVEIFIVEI